MRYKSKCLQHLNPKQPETPIPDDTTFTPQDWKDNVATDCTRLGYDEWVIERHQEANAECQADIDAEKANERYFENRGADDADYDRMMEDSRGVIQFEDAFNYSNNTDGEEMKIKIRYSSIDRYSESRTFKTLKFARRYAHKWIGEHPEIGFDYAVSGDGVGKITVQGATLDDLFGKEPQPDHNQVFCINYDCDAHGKPVNSKKGDLCKECGKAYTTTVEDYLSDPPDELR